MYGRQCYPQWQLLDSLLLTDINYLDIDMKNIIHRFGENIKLGGVANNKENSSPLQQSMEKVADKVQWIVVWGDTFLESKMERYIKAQI